MRMNMRKLTLLLISTLVPLAGAEKRKTTGAHEHGTAKLNIVIEGRTLAIEWEAPAEGVVGFEHLARTPAEKANESAALAQLKGGISRMVVLEPALGCRFEPKRVAVVKEAGENHSEVKAEFSVSCAKRLTGSKITFGVAKVFPRIQQVEVQLLNGAQQAGLVVKMDRGALTVAE